MYCTKSDSNWFSTNSPNWILRKLITEIRSQCVLIENIHVVVLYYIYSCIYINNNSRYIYIIYIKLTVVVFRKACPETFTFFTPSYLSGFCVCVTTKSMSCKKRRETAISYWQTIIKINLNKIMIVIMTDFSGETTDVYRSQKAFFSEGFIYLLSPFEYKVVNISNSTMIKYITFLQW